MVSAFHSLSVVTLSRFASPCFAAPPSAFTPSRLMVCHGWWLLVNIVVWIVFFLLKNIYWSVFLPAMNWCCSEIPGLGALVGKISWITLARPWNCLHWKTNWIFLFCSNAQIATEKSFILPSAMKPNVPLASFFYTERMNVKAIN